MKIPSDPPRPIGQPLQPEAQRRATGAALPGVEPGAANETAIVRPGASWSRAALDEPAAAARMFSEALGQVIDASPAASQLRPEQRLRLERLLGTDPVMRDLVTRSMERAVK